MMEASDKIKYRSGYKYQLVEDYTVKTSTRPKADVYDEFIWLNTAGEMTIKAGYAWDGPSGPTIDTKNFMRASLVHDAQYQLLRQGYLPEDQRQYADYDLRRLCLEDGMSKTRAWYVYRSVRKYGKPAATIKRKIFTAP